MMTKSKTFAERIVGNALWTAVTDALLTSTLHWNWVSFLIIITTTPFDSARQLTV
jgi:hypothetical protein